MLDIDFVKSLELVFIFLVPGLVAIYARGQFLTGRHHELRDDIPVYLFISSVYYAFVFPFAEYVVSIDGASWWRVSMWMLLVGLGPVVFGSLLGIMASYGFAKKIISWFGIPIVHPMPTAWDYKLSQRNEQFVLVTLKNGTVFAGKYGVKSFASSDSVERDLYLEEIYDWSGNKEWTARVGKGVWLTGSEILSIEFK